MPSDEDLEAKTEPVIPNIGMGRFSKIAETLTRYFEYKQSIGIYISRGKQDRIYLWLVEAECYGEPKRCHNIECEFDTAYAILLLDEDKGRENVANFCTMPDKYPCESCLIAKPLGEIAYFYVKSLSEKQLTKMSLWRRVRRKEFQYGLFTQWKNREEGLPICYTKDCGRLAFEDNVKDEFREKMREFLDALGIDLESGLCTNLEVYLCDQGQATEEK